MHISPKEMHNYSVFMHIYSIFACPFNNYSLNLQSHGSNSYSFIMNNNIKTQLQNREFANLKYKNRVVLKWATGCGKSKMTIDLINNAISSRNKTPARILFVVAEVAHINNWKDELLKWKLDLNKCATTMVCYASLHKVVDQSWDVVVLDECHHAFTEKRQALLQKMAAWMLGNTYVYLLSATLSSAKLDIAESIFGKFTTSTVTLKEAIKSDILAKPRVYVVEMELDSKRVTEEIKIGKGDDLPIVAWENRNKYIYNKTPCIIRCTEYQKYLYYTTTMDYWKQRYQLSKNNFHHNKWVNLGSIRKRFLGEKKTEIVYRLISSFPLYTRFVCFCSSIAQAECLSGRYTISSKKPAKTNQHIISAFNARAISQLYAVGMITEGMNLTNIHVGIIVQLDGKERLFIQKFGRSMRSEDPVSFIFYYKGTQDEVYLKGALENIDSKFVKYITPNQLNTVKL